jgi:hypothetical protein
MKPGGAFITALLLVPLATLLAADKLKSAARPNILLITAADLHWDSVGVYGCPVAATTPNLDRLAAQGFRCQYAYVPISLCPPPRQAILSGNHSHQTQTREFTELERGGPALPDLLEQNGYYLANLNKQQDYYVWDTAITEEQPGFGRDVPFFKRAVGKIIATATGKHQPWFMMANSNDPHHPFYDSAAELGVPRLKEFREQGRLSRASREYRPDEVVVPGFLPDLPETKRTEMLSPEAGNLKGLTKAGEFYYVPGLGRRQVLEGSCRDREGQRIALRPAKSNRSRLCARAWLGGVSAAHRRSGVVCPSRACRQERSSQSEIAHSLPPPSPEHETT